MTPQHSVRLIAQEWRNFKMRLDSAMPGWEKTDDYLASLMLGSRRTLDMAIDEAMANLPAREPE